MSRQKGWGWFQDRCWKHRCCWALVHLQCKSGEFGTITLTGVTERSSGCWRSVTNGALVRKKMQICSAEYEGQCNPHLVRVTEEKQTARMEETLFPEKIELEILQDWKKWEYAQLKNTTLMDIAGSQRGQRYQIHKCNAFSGGKGTPQAGFLAPAMGARDSGIVSSQHWGRTIAEL